MVAVRMGNETIGNLIPIEVVFLVVPDGIGVEIHQQIVVDKRLRTRTQISSAALSRQLAYSAITEQRRHALVRRRTQVLDFHSVFSFCLRNAQTISIIALTARRRQATDYKYKLS